MGDTRLGGDASDMARLTRTALNGLYNNDTNIHNEQRCALFYYTVRAPRGWDRILLIFSKDVGSSTMRFFLFE